MDRDSFFDNLRSENTVRDELIRAQRQLAYEERVIKRVFSECGIKINGWGRFVNECREVTGHDRLNFQWFNNRFRGFPRLAARRIPRLHELTMHDLFKPLERNRLLKAVVKALHRAELSIDTRFIFVFPVVRMSFCAHNVPTASPGPALDMRDGDGKLHMTVEPTKSFFQGFGSSWYEG